MEPCVPPGCWSQADAQGKWPALPGPRTLPGIPPNPRRSRAPRAPGRDSRQLPELEQILLHGRAAAGPPLASLRAGMAGGGRERRGWTAPGPGQRRERAERTERTERSGAERNGSALLGTARLGSVRHGWAQLSSALLGTARLDY